jgi:vacuolar protein sorting-associated protein 11
LIKYLEKLIETPTASTGSLQNLNSMGDYNKDYTALLLNCYVKNKQQVKIQELIKKSETASSGDSIFDIDTAIEVCRQQEETLDQAEALSEKSKKFKLLVQIKIENRHDNQAALNIIDQKIHNLKEKVECLQQYVPKLLKTKQSKNIAETVDRKAIAEK